MLACGGKLDNDERGFYHPDKLTLSALSIVVMGSLSLRSDFPSKKALIVSSGNRVFCARSSGDKDCFSIASLIRSRINKRESCSVSHRSGCLACLNIALNASWSGSFFGR